jgi:uncharacterized protein with GYD domain
MTEGGRTRPVRGDCTTRKVAFLFTLSSEALARLLDHPTSREEALGTAAEAAGGRLDSYYWMFGAFDGVVIVELPDSRAAAAMSLAMSSTGTYGHVQTQELIPPQELVAVLGAARKSRLEPVAS